MNSRIREHARILVEHCIDVQTGDEVLIQAPPEAMDLVVALNETLAERGAYPLQFNFAGQDRANRAFLQAMEPAEYDDPPTALLKAVEHADAGIGIGAASNTHELSDVPPEKTTAFQQLLKPIMDEFLNNRWVATQHPAPGNAQDAEMSTEAYAEFVYDAINKDWDAQREFQANMVERLEDGTEVRLVVGETTDLTMSIAGMQAVNDYAEINLPGGEVYTAPVPDSVEGEVLFDKPVMVHGREVENVRLVFEDGEVVEHHAEQNEDVLTGLLETDEGARRLGELGIGMNRAIDQFTYNMLFDEKMGDTIHLALGRAYEETVGAEQERNESAIHQDMIVDVSEASTLEIDGEVVQRDGTFVFEDNFQET